MRQTLDTLKVATKGRGFHEITSDVQEQVAQAGVQTGLCTLHLQHTSASLLIQENADPDVRRDFERFFARLVPDGDRLFVHTAEGDDDMPAHVRTALTTVNLSGCASAPGRESTCGSTDEYRTPDRSSFTSSATSGKPLAWPSGDLAPLAASPWSGREMKTTTLTVDPSVNLIVLSRLAWRLAP